MQTADLTKQKSLPTNTSQIRLRLAYLISQYPAISHTFILREINQLRNQGLDIHVASINAPDRSISDLTNEEVTEATSTHYIKKQGAWGALKSHFTTLRTHPRAYIKGLLFALKLAPTDLKKTFYNLLYFIEAIMVGSWMKKNKCDHLHVHFATPASTVGMIASQTFPIKYSFTVHGPDEFYNTSNYYLTQKLHTASFVCCIGTYAQSQVMKLSDPSHWHKFEISPLGVDLNTFTPRPFDTPSNHFEILCVGRLVPAKGQHILLQACHKLIKEGYDIHLRFVGDGPDRPSLQQTVQANQLHNHVTFEGAVNQDQIHTFYQHADVFALASFAEGIPVVLMEAMAMEIPCISTTITGIPELIQSGINGYLVPPSDVQTLASTIAQLIDAPEQRLIVGLNARKRVAEKYHIQKNTQKLAHIFSNRLRARS